MATRAKAKAKPRAKAKAKPRPRAVPAADQPSRQERKEHSVLSAVKDGDRLDLLLAQRRVIAKAVDSDKTSARDLAALTKRLEDVDEKIRILEADEEARDADNGPAEDEAFDGSAV